MAILWPVYKDSSTSERIRSHPPTSLSPSTRASSRASFIASEAQEWKSKDEILDPNDVESLVHERLVEEEFHLLMETTLDDLNQLTPDVTDLSTYLSCCPVATALYFLA